MKTSAISRAERERLAYDEGRVWEVNDAWHRRFSHVFGCPNTVRHEALFRSMLAERARGKRVLDLGCGFGEFGPFMQAAGCSYYLGVDVSEDSIEKAQEHAVPGLVEYQVVDAEAPLTERFDLIFGESVLHHLDFRSMLPRLRAENLTPEGSMVFAEPLGSNLLIKLYWYLARGAHTDDEKALTREDLRWMASNFSGFEMLPFNYFSFVGGVLSSRLSKNPSNGFMRLCDRLDVLAARAPWLRPSFRRAILDLR